MTDAAAYSDLIFGLFRLLGFQFNPRLADLGHTRFWRINRRAEYGPLNSLARSHINLKLIRSHWDDILRVVGSLVQGTVRASELIRALQRGGDPLLWRAPSLKLGESPRHFTFWPASTTKHTTVTSCDRSIEGKGATVSLDLFDELAGYFLCVVFSALPKGLLRHLAPPFLVVPVVPGRVDLLHGAHVLHHQTDRSPSSHVSSTASPRFNAS